MGRTVLQCIALSLVALRSVRDFWVWRNGLLCSALPRVLEVIESALQRFALCGGDLAEAI